MCFELELLLLEGTSWIQPTMRPVVTNMQTSSDNTFGIHWHPVVNIRYIVFMTPIVRGCNPSASGSDTCDAGAFLLDFPCLFVKPDSAERTTDVGRRCCVLTL